LVLEVEAALLELLHVLIQSRIHWRCSLERELEGVLVGEASTQFRPGIHDLG
jgi:hypothetical protein